MERAGGGGQWEELKREHNRSPQQLVADWKTEKKEQRRGDGHISRKRKNLKNGECVCTEKKLCGKTGGFERAENRYAGRMQMLSIYWYLYIIYCLQYTIQYTVGTISYL